MQLFGACVVQGVAMGEGKPVENGMTDEPDLTAKVSIDIECQNEVYFCFSQKAFFPFSSGN